MAKHDIDKWKESIESGIRYKEKFGGAKSWATYKNYYRGQFPGYNNASNTGGVLPYNLTYAMKSTLIPNIYFRNPYITVSPRYKPGMEVHAKVMEAVDNWLVQEIDIKKVMKHSAGCAYFTNRGFIKLGYDSQFGFDVNKIEADKGFSDTTFTSFSKKGEKIEYASCIKPGMPWAVSVQSENIVVPFGIYDFDDCPWIDHIIIRPLADVKADTKYINTKELTGSHMETLKKDSKRAAFYSELEKSGDFVALHEIRDIRSGEIMVMADGYDKWLRAPEQDVLQFEGLPFVTFTFNDDTELFWGSSDVEIMEPQQLEMNEARTQAMRHRRIALVKFLVEEGGMDLGEIDKMLSESVAPAVITKGDPRKVISILQPHIPQDLLLWSDGIRGDVRELMGQGRNQMGQEAQSSRRTATEAGIVQMAHDLRMDERRDVMADVLVKTVRKMNQSIFKFWSAKRVVQVVGYDGAKYWVEYTNDAIQGEYNLSIDIESMTPQTKAIKRRDLVQLIQALSKNPRVNIDYLMRALLKEYNYIDAMKVLPDAQETQSQPMGMDEHVKFQNQLLNNPALLQARAQQNANKVGG